MRNRAKCKLCSDVIESLVQHDYVPCKCGEIAVDGGPEYFRAIARDFANFIRVDDNDMEFPVTVVNSPDLFDNAPIESENKLKRNLMDELESMVNNIDKLPPHAMSLSINHYDFAAALILIQQIFKDLEKRISEGK